MIDFGCSFDYQLSLSELINRVQKAESSGFTFALIPDCIPYPKCRDVFVTLSAIATLTDHIRLGTGIINPYNRHPLMIAYAMNSLQELSKGRAFVTLGAGSRMSLGPMGQFPQKRPAKALQEATEILTGIQQSKGFNYSGDLFKAINADFEPKVPYFPVYLSGRGPRILRLMGRTGNGGFALIPPKAAQIVMDHITQGAPVSSDRTYGIWLSSHISRKPPLKYGREHKYHVFFCVAQTLPEINELMGISTEQVTNMQSVFRKKGYDAINELVTDTMVENYGFVGSPDQITDQIQIAIKAGFTRFVFAEPHGEPWDQGLQMITEEIIPHFQS